MADRHKSIKPPRPLPRVEPVLIFSYLNAEDLAGHDPKELLDSYEALYKAVGACCQYPWSNSHFAITDFSGRVVVKVSFYEDHTTFWTVSPEYHIVDLNLTNVTGKVIKEIIEKVSEGNAMCAECHKWFQQEDMKSYSFTGIVCKGCYDPKRHRPPDTRGD